MCKFVHDNFSTHQFLGVWSTKRLVGLIPIMMVVQNRSNSVRRVRRRLHNNLILLEEQPNVKMSDSAVPRR